MATFKGLSASVHLGIELGVRAQVVQDRGFNSAEAEVVRVILDFGGTKANFRASFRTGRGIALGRSCGRSRNQLIDNGASGIAQGEKPGNFIVSFAGSIVAGLAEAPVVQGAGCHLPRGTAGGNFVDYGVAT